MKQSRLRLISKILYWVLIVLLVAVAGIAALSAFDIPGGTKLFSVQSGSMEPAIKTGSVVLVKPVAEYNKGDIITFINEADRDNPNPLSTTTHRIHDVVETDGSVAYVTKGDANDSPDGGRVDSGLISGKALFSVPYLGYLVSFAKTEWGLIFLIIIPATLIIYNEVLSIKREAKRLIDERKKRKLSTREEIVTILGKPVSLEDSYRDIFSGRSNL
jgi:signal peptidase I